MIDLGGYILALGDEVRRIDPGCKDYLYGRVLSIQDGSARVRIRQAGGRPGLLVDEWPLAEIESLWRQGRFDARRTAFSPALPGPEETTPPPAGPPAPAPSSPVLPGPEEVSGDRPRTARPVHDYHEMGF